MKLWLKIISIACLIYTTVFSLWHPMAPGGLEISASMFHPGRNDFSFTGYATHFQENSGSMQVFVTVDSSAVYCADILNVTDNAHVIVSVFLPDTISSNQFGFLANNHVDGTLLVEAPVGSEGFTFIEGTKNDSCQYKVEHENHSIFGFPFQPIIMESIRNLMWHVPMWFTMFALMIISFIFSIRTLNNKSGTPDLNFDRRPLRRSNGFGLCTPGNHRFSLGSLYLNCMVDQRPTT
ncbi:MAG: hypothetical protein IPP69_09320 [Flavobacteriales bacterium]|nr:hypothetical protein [Flavobacteriales bacterium]